MSYWGRWRLKSPAFRWFTQPFVQAQIKENINAPRLWPLWGEFTGHRWIPHKGQVTRKMFPFDDVIMHTALMSLHSLGYHKEFTLTPVFIVHVGYIANRTGNHSGYRLSQWETALQWKVHSHWLGPYPEWSLCPFSSSTMADLEGAC